MEGLREKRYEQASPCGKRLYEQGDRTIKKNMIGAVALVIVAGIALITAVAHMSCIVLGEACYRAQLAPEPVVQSAIQGTWEAPISTTFVSVLFVVCAIYALSAAQVIRPVPFLKLGIFCISGLCIIRGIATIPIVMMLSGEVPMFALVSGFLWFLSGVLCIVGYFMVNEKVRDP